MTYHNNHYNPTHKEYARELRKNSVSRAEKFLWKSLLRKKKMGVRFLRQRPIDRFIVDFFSPEVGLIIEVDGSSHLNKGDYDQYRQERLEMLGYTIIRFSEGAALNQIEEVRNQVNHAIYCLK